MTVITTDRRHYEDLSVGETVALGSMTLTRDMIVSWAKEFDPLPFHLDEEVARKSLLGGLAASGWQTGALTLRLLGDTFLNTIAAAGGLGFSNLKWKKPVMVGDTICPTARIASLRRSAHHPDRGIMSLDLVVKNQKGEEVMTMTLANLVETREVRP
jgi:acyl dehydratase